MSDVPETFQPAPPGMPPAVRAALDKGEQAIEQAQSPEPADEEAPPGIPPRIELPGGKWVTLRQPSELRGRDARRSIAGLQDEGPVGFAHGIAPGAIADWNLTDPDTGAALALPRDDEEAMDKVAFTEANIIYNHLVLYIKHVAPLDPPEA